MVKNRTLCQKIHPHPFPWPCFNCRSTLGLASMWACIFYIVFSNDRKECCSRSFDHDQLWNWNSAYPPHYWIFLWFVDRKSSKEVDKNICRYYDYWLWNFTIQDSFFLLKKYFALKIFS